jgi:hypothetical protein
MGSISHSGLSTLEHPLAGDHPKIAVHPGWLLPESAPQVVEGEDEDSVRFGAFMQLLRTAGALDRAATDALVPSGRLWNLAQLAKPELRHLNLHAALRLPGALLRSTSIFSRGRAGQNANHIPMTDAWSSRD